MMFRLLEKRVVLNNNCYMSNDMLIALLAALVKSFTHYTTFDDYIGVCAKLILGTISRNNNFLPSYFIRIDVVPTSNSALYRLLV